MVQVHDTKLGPNVMFYKTNTGNFYAVDVFFSKPKKRHVYFTINHMTL